MKFFLDTHTFLWFIDGNLKLSATARQLIENPDNERLISIASLWEMAIKTSMGKLIFDEPFDQFVSTQIQWNNIQVLNITTAHTAYVSTLPFYHRDPFDRMLIAQAMVETIPILSADSAFDSYGVTRLW
ncbi:MAG: type II toxin-antitoxin system VapC family toxin [Chloroflexi bacterium AL-W]|nr:type II toxin-antitoxin system VapC family toxin [Chloroflexi bacterium AL-N1]NOK67806.1 type II toxin-antitoxin system VapC family toxin [Chloroflexi bacterium AL-N10]NOK75424.1 type II toxin-antitoxin system VapC family toxin [Chloroflexi bacterium AL-N5]NOK82212.1 type II toxin-antitoxin system VapC family toxin [Chloroflexi bacterium AL-W]NOK90057.1 type II toxin-antitoxin system VapC family toxin [Chloroflexi bacterium AL-N15]